MGLFGHVVDRAAGRTFAGEQRGRTFQKLDLLKIAHVDDAAGHARRPDLDAVVKRVDLIAAEAAHRKVGRRTWRIAGRHPDGGLHRLRGGPKPAILQGLLIDDLDRRRRLARREFESACAFGDNIGVERCRVGAALLVTVSAGAGAGAGCVQGRRVAPASFRRGAVTSIRSSCSGFFSAGAGVCACVGLTTVPERTASSAATHCRFRPTQLGPRKIKTRTRGERGAVTANSDRPRTGARGGDGERSSPRDTPPNALARDHDRWQVSWLAGQSPSTTFPGTERPQWLLWSSARRLQLRGQLRNCIPVIAAGARAPHSLGYPLARNHREHARIGVQISQEVRSSVNLEGF